MSLVDAEYDTDREVGGIVYQVTQVYGKTIEGKNQAMTEAYFNRVRGFFARAMRIKGGDYEGHWACYVSRVRRDF